MAVVLLTGDLTVISRVEGAAKLWGQSVRAFSSASQALAHCSWDDANLLIVDLATLSTQSVDMKALLETLQQITSTPPRVVAFGPHVHEARLAAAREAGCDEVMSRGEFFARVNAILQGVR
jgi:DNA-binding NarL/FixJ family response regulator